VPDKRQTSKQRRAARNRASRQSLAARRDNAVAAPAPSSRSGGSSGAGKGRASGSASAGGAARVAAAPGGPPPKGLLGLARSTRVGDKAVLFMFVWTVLVGIGLPLLYRVPVDDRGEPIPVGSFGGLYRAAREQVTGQPVPDATSSLLDASGPTILLLLGLPIVTAGFALWANTRPDRARWLTYAMFAMAVAVIMSGQVGIFFFPALIALAIGGFRVRKADLPARMAERSTGGRTRARGRVVDADSREVDADDLDAADEFVDDDLDAADEFVDEELDAEELTDEEHADEELTDEPAEDEVIADEHVEDDEALGAAGDAPEDEVEYDPLAELEAELEAERAAGADDEARDRNGPKA
jgi:hypothetical protein